MLYPVIDLYRTGSNIRKLRKERKLSVHDICTFMGGISEQAVHKWESGSGLPTVENFYALSILFHVNMNEIIEEADEASSFCLSMQKKAPVEVPFVSVSCFSTMS